MMNKYPKNGASRNPIYGSYPGRDEVTRILGNSFKTRFTSSKLVFAQGIDTTEMLMISASDVKAIQR